MGGALPEAEVFALYQRLGSYGEVTGHLAREGVLNPLTGKPYSRLGVRNMIVRAPGYEAWRKKRRQETLAAFKRATKRPVPKRKKEKA